MSSEFLDLSIKMHELAKRKDYLTRHYESQRRTMNDDERKDMTETMDKLNADIEKTQDNLNRVIDQISRKRSLAASVAHRVIASKDIPELYEDTLDEFESGKNKQRWEVVPRNKVIKVWRSFAKTGQVTSEEIFEIYEQTLDNLKQVVVNSMIQDSDHINDDNLNAWSAFINDERGRGRYTDQDVRFGKALTKLERAQTPTEKLLTVDQVFNLVHGIGPVADWFVEGGTRTLSELEEWQAPKKASISSQINIIASIIYWNIRNA